MKTNENQKETRITNKWEEGYKNNGYQQMKIKIMKQTSLVDEKKKTKISITN